MLGDRYTIIVLGLTLKYLEVSGNSNPELAALVMPSKAPFEKKQSKRMMYKLKCRIKFHAIQLGQERGTTKLCQGAAEWASKVNAKLVFKDLARRAHRTLGGFIQSGSSWYPGVGRTTRFFNQKKRDVKPILKKNGLLTRFFTQKKPCRRLR